MTHRTRHFNTIEIPSSTTVQVHVCGEPKCEHLHLIGFDDEGKPLCEIVVSEGVLLQMIQKLPVGAE